MLHGSSPENKLNIVKALQSKHHSVAMTGDGVNGMSGLRSLTSGLSDG
jgi:Ca2+-transporting ATPase